MTPESVWVIMDYSIKCQKHSDLFNSIIGCGRHILKINKFVLFLSLLLIVVGTLYIISIQKYPRWKVRFI